MCHDARRDPWTPFAPGFSINTNDWTATGPEQCTAVDFALWWAGAEYEGAPAAGFYTEATCDKMAVPAHSSIQKCKVIRSNPCLTGGGLSCPDGSICVDDGLHGECACPHGLFPLQPFGVDCSSRALVMSVLVDDTRAFQNDVQIEALLSSVLQAQVGVSVLPSANTSLISRHASLFSVNVPTSTRTWKLSFDIPFQWLDVALISQQPAAVRTSVNDAIFAAGYTLSAGENSVAFVEVHSERHVVDIESSGYRLIKYEWVENDARGLGWQVDLEMSPDSSAERVLYVSRAGAENKLLAANDAEVPCRVGFTTNSSCCLRAFLDLFHVVDSLESMDCPDENTPMPALAVDGRLVVNGSSYAQATHGDKFITVRIFLRLEDIQRMFGVEHPSETGIRLTWFLGIAQFRTHAGVTSISTSHTAFESNIATSQTKVTAMSATQTFAPFIDIQLSRVQDVDKGRFFDFVSFTLTIPEQDRQLSFAVEDTVPENSALVYIGLTESDHSRQSLQYPCHGYDSSEFQKIMAANPCAHQENICAANVLTPKSLKYTFPLGQDIFSDALSQYDDASLLKKNIYFDFYVRMQNDAEGLAIVERIRTQTEISRISMAVMCAEVSLKVSLADAVHFDIISGLLRDRSSANQTGVYFGDVSRAKESSECDSREPSSLCLPSPDFGMGSVTFLVLGDAAVFGGGRSMQNVRISSMFSVYFLSEVKRIAALNLIRQGRAFLLRDGESIENSTQLIPSIELLNLCPMHVVPDSFGCISRFEVEDGVYDFETNSIVPVGIRRADNGTEQNISTFVTQSWVSAGDLGQSDFVSDAVGTHVDVLVQTFNLNERFRRAFMLAPRLPWSKTELAALNLSDVSISVAQDIFTFTVVTVDSDLNSFTETAVYRLIIPTAIPLSCSLFTQYPYLQGRYVDVYAMTLGLNRDLVRVDSEGQPLSSQTSCRFNISLDFPVQRELRAFAKASKLKMLLDDKNSDIAQRLASSLSATFSEIQDFAGLSFSSLSRGAFQSPLRVELKSLKASPPQPSLRRLLATSASGDDIMPPTLNRNASNFAAGMSNRRYRDVNSADKMTEIAESLLIQKSGSDAVVKGSSRMMLVEMRVPADIACLGNETMVLKKLKEYLNDPLAQSSSGISAVTPTSFVILDEIDCNFENSRRRLLQQRFFYSYTEMVVSPAPETIVEGKSSVVFSATPILYNLPAGIQFVALSEVPSAKENATTVGDSWGGGEIPPQKINDFKLVFVEPEPPDFMQKIRIVLYVSIALAAMNLVLVVACSLPYIQTSPKEPVYQFPVYYFEHVGS